MSTKTSAFWGAHTSGVRHAYSLCCPHCQNFCKSRTVSWFDSVVGYRSDTMSLAATIALISGSDAKSAQHVVIHQCPLCYNKFWLHVDSGREDFKRYQNSANWPTKSE